jgi:hypothetical protein
MRNKVDSKSKGKDSGGRARDLEMHLKRERIDEIVQVRGISTGSTETQHLPRWAWEGTGARYMLVYRKGQGQRFAPIWDGLNDTKQRRGHVSHTPTTLFHT